MRPTWSARVRLIRCDLPLSATPSRSAKLFRFSDRSIHLANGGAVLVIVSPVEIERIEVGPQRLHHGGGLRSYIAKKRADRDALIEIFLRDGRMLVALAPGQPAAVVETMFS